MAPSFPQYLSKIYVYFASNAFADMGFSKSELNLFFTVFTPMFMLAVALQLRAVVDERRVRRATTVEAALALDHGPQGGPRATNAQVFAGLRGLEAAVQTLWRMPLLNARKEPIWRLWAQAQQIASLVDMVSLLVSRVPGAPMQMPHAEPARARAGHAAHSAAPRAAPAAEAAQPARPAAAAAPVASAGGGPATERPASGATRAASARGPSRRGGLPARVGDTSLRRSFVLSIPVARGANWFLAGGGRRMDEEEATAAAAERIAAAAEDGTSLPVRLATDVVRFLYGGTGRREPADGGVVSASLLNAKPAVGGIGVEPRGGGVLRVLFTVASDAVADTVVRWRHELRRCVDSTAVFDVLSDREEAQHQALWPAFLAAKVAGKRAQFHRARLVVDGERAPLHVIEIGCGCGSSILPVLANNPDVWATLTDVSSTCIEQLRGAGAAMGLPQHQLDALSSFVCDSSLPSEAHRFEGVRADAALIMFTLSAVDPPGQASMLANAAAALRPGGLLLLRDHGLYDMVQLRIPPEQWLAPNMYKRGDGTLAYFFSLDDLSGKAEAAGLEVVEAKYVCVVNRNKKTGVELRRVFVHGVFRKPVAEEPGQPAAVV
ncbi:hypothetical protein FOA52_003079 [Chlamydomonas sp. UWO 241]|nr:hypothetical protein FOA52_003079 [Chlamydomonas sp. UWO 241]